MSRAHIYSGLTREGIAQAGAVPPFTHPLRTWPKRWPRYERRRDVMLDQLEGLPTVRPAGGWSMLMDVEALGLSPPDLSRALVKRKARGLAREDGVHHLICELEVRARGRQPLAAPVDTLGDRNQRFKAKDGL